MEDFTVCYYTKFSLYDNDKKILSTSNLDDVQDYIENRLSEIKKIYKKALFTSISLNELQIKSNDDNLLCQLKLEKNFR